LSGTWGDTVNNSITSLLDSAIAGTTTLSADTTLTTTTGASNQARQAILLCTGHVANITITAPAQSKIYTVINASATYTVKIRGVGPTTGITIPVSSTATVAWNGTDFVKVASTQATALTGILPIANGGTGASTLAGANLPVTNVANTFTATQTLSGSSSAEALVTPNIAEVDTISATAATGTINFDITTQSVLYYTSNASGNFTLNFRGSSGTSLNTLMQTGESISATFLVTNGTTAYYNSAVTIDGTSVTPKWQGGSAPTSGNASSTDCYTYVIQKTGSATYVVLASQTKFA
jgi:hypothetical protein